MTIESINPATEETLATFPEHTREQTQRFIAQADDAFRSWRETSFDERARLMRRAAAILRERAPRYGALITAEMGKPIAEAAVAACRYPPQGIRSNGANRAILYAGGDYVANANDQLCCIPMIETKQAIENLDDILSVPGVDGIYIGPSDLSFALGLPPRMDNEDPLHVATVDRILEACKRHGVAAGAWSER